mgnify:CR=1 FL=1
MKYFTREQFESLADRFISEMNAHITQDVTGGTMPQYRSVLNMASEENPVSDEQKAKFKEKFVELLEAKAVQQEARNDETPDDIDFMKGEYSCIRLEVDHAPDETIGAALKHAEIKDCHVRLKRFYMICPDQEKIIIQQMDDGKCFTRKAPKPAAAQEPVSPRMKM